MKAVSKILVLRCIAILTASQLLIMLIHLSADGQLPVFSSSISHYVGSAWWSAVVFAVGNMFITINIWRFFRLISSQKEFLFIFWGPIVVMTIGLVGLSLCPIGLFDISPAEPSVISYMHGVFSRMMFLFILLLMFLMTVSYARKSKLTCGVGAFFTIYGVYYAVAYAIQTPLIQADFFILEELSLYGFFIFLLTIPYPDKEPLEE